MIRCASWVSWVPSSGPLTLFDERDGSYHTLNRTGSAIWSALATGQQPDEIGAMLAASHDAPLALVQGDVDAFVATSLEKGLLAAE